MKDGHESSSSSSSLPIMNHEAKALNFNTVERDRAYALHILRTGKAITSHLRQSFNELKLELKHELAECALDLHASSTDLMKFVLACRDRNPPYPPIQDHKQRLDPLDEPPLDEQRLEAERERRKYWQNQALESRGNIRVCCRVRPLETTELAVQIWSSCDQIQMKTQQTTTNRSTGSRHGLTSRSKSKSKHGTHGLIRL